MVIYILAWTKMNGAVPDSIMHTMTRQSGQEEMLCLGTRSHKVKQKMSLFCTWPLMPTGITDVMT